MKQQDNDYGVESDEAVNRLVEDSIAVAAASDFVVNTRATIDMKTTPIDWC